MQAYAGFIDPKHLKGPKTEAPIEKESWQDALQTVYSLTINQLKIIDGELTYVQEGLSKPFKVRDIKIVARNIKISGLATGSILRTS